MPTDNNDGNNSDDPDIPYPPYPADILYRPHRRSRHSSSSDNEETEYQMTERVATRDYHRKRLAKGAEFGYVDAEDEEGRQFQVPCCTPCGKSWCDTLTCKRNPIKKCTSCDSRRIGNEWVFETGDNYWQQNRRCRKRQPPSLFVRGGRSRKRIKRKKRRKTKKKTRRKKRRKTKKKRRR